MSFVSLSQLHVSYIKTCAKYQSNHIGGYICICSYTTPHALPIGPYQLRSDLNINVFSKSFGILQTRSEIKEVINKHHCCRCFWGLPTIVGYTFSLCSRIDLCHSEKCHNCFSATPRLDSHDSKPHKLSYILYMLYICLFMYVLPYMPVHIVEIYT